MRYTFTPRRLVRRQRSAALEHAMAGLVTVAVLTLTVALAIWITWAENCANRCATPIVVDGPDGWPVCRCP